MTDCRSIGSTFHASALQASIIGFIIFANQIVASPLPDISADGAILIEPKTNTIIYSKNMNQTFYPASTTKILTALAILQDLPSDMVITKTQTAVDEVPSDSSQIGLSVGKCQDGTLTN